MADAPRDAWIDELERDLGQSAALQLLAAAGGQRRTIPRHAKGSRLSAELSVEIVTWLAARFGGTDVDIPSLRGRQQQDGAAQLRAAILEAGLTDPIWLKIYPPNGYFCGCTVAQMTAGQLRREGRTVSPPLDLDPEPWTNKRTGEVFDVPAGITPGFDANPGAAWLDLGDALDRMTPDLTPERRATERGILQGLRVRRVGERREALVVLGDQPEPAFLNWASPEKPGQVSLGKFKPAPGASYIHSHLTEASLSADDLELLFDNAGHAMSAISPGGSIWRAVRQPNVVIAPWLREWRNNIYEFDDEFSKIQDGAVVYFHARLLWLEKKGAITYSWHMSERVRQILDAHADLVQRLIDARS